MAFLTKNQDYTMYEIRYNETLEPSIYRDRIMNEIARIYREQDYSRAQEFIRAYKGIDGMTGVHQLFQTCPECGEVRPDDERVKEKMKCGICAYN